MSTTLRLPTRSRTPRRTQLLASLSAFVAAASVAVVLALSGGGGDATGSGALAAPATATPDRATLYRNGAALGRPEQSGGPSAAERFHHFR